MNRVLVVATSEFLSLVKTKAFLIGIAMMPILVGVSIAIQVFAAKRVDRDDHVFAVIDRTGVLYAPLAAAADAHNRDAGAGETRTGPYFLPREIAIGGQAIDAVRLDLSERVRSKELFAFIEIPSSVFDPDAKADPIDYYTETPSYDTLPNWIEQKLTAAITERRFTQAAIDPKLVARLTRRVDVSTNGLVERNPDGTVRQAKKTNPIATYVLPFGMMYLLFIAVMTIAPQLLNAVIEEKMSRISEVLVASISPTQLLLGKLVGSGLVAVVLALVYFAGGAYALFNSGQWDLLQPALLGWFVLFLLCAVTIFGAIFIAIGSACSDLKDAQGMMQPVMLLVMLPLFVSAIVLRAPNSGIAVGASLFPTATPFLMMMRLAMQPGPPMWQVALSVVLTLGTAAALVWAAGRIFRVGLLMQGKAPTLPELIRWLRA